MDKSDKTYFGWLCFKEVNGNSSLIGKVFVADRSSFDLSGTISKQEFTLTFNNEIYNFPGKIQKSTVFQKFEIESHSLSLKKKKKKDFNYFAFVLTPLKEDDNLPF